MGLGAAARDLDTVEQVRADRRVTALVRHVQGDVARLVARDGGGFQHFHGQHGVAGEVAAQHGSVAGHGFDHRV